MTHEHHPSDRHFDHCPWLFAAEASAEQRAAQDERRAAIGGDSEFGERCFVAGSAAVFPDRLRLGDDSYIAAHAYVTGELTTGADCTLNPYTTVRGTVALGDGVRIGAHTSLLGFNHAMAPDRPVFRQPLTSRGITVGDDVWIGSHVVVVDGVTIGDHCVIGAGAVVTRDLPAWTVAAGNPARAVRDRRDVGGSSSGRRDAGGSSSGRRDAGRSSSDRRDAGRSSSDRRDAGRSSSDRRDAGRSSSDRRAAEGGSVSLVRFTETVRAQAAGLLARCWDGERYVDRPGAAPTVRAHCDAVEIADLVLGAVPEQLTADAHVERLASAQDAASGLVPEVGEPVPEAEADGSSGRGPRSTTSCRWATRSTCWAPPSLIRCAG